MEKKRYVAYHPAFGVLLTDPVIDASAYHYPAVEPAWSLLKPVPVAFAPTFQSWAEVDMLLSRFPTPLLPADRKKLQLREVYADCHGNVASVESCANAGLPRWDVEDGVDVD
jgi:hypothetical protein